MGVPYHSEKQVFVISKDPQTSPHSNIHFFKGNVKELITQLKSNSNHNIYCDGGSQLANSLIQEGLIDEIIVSVAPIYLNKGTLLFEAGKVPKDFELLSIKEFSSGLVQYHYVIKAI
jgi:dihydrofolate reductase